MPIGLPPRRQVEVGANAALARDEVPAGHLRQLLAGVHPDPRRQPPRDTRLVDPLELQPHVAVALLLVDASDEVPAHVLGAGREWVELGRTDVAVEAERKQQLQCLRLPGRVVATQQQPPASEVEHLVGVLVEVDDARSPRPPAVRAGTQEAAPPDRTAGSRKRAASGVGCRPPPSVRRARPAATSTSAAATVRCASWAGSSRSRRQ